MSSEEDWHAVDGRGLCLGRDSRGRYGGLLRCVEGEAAAGLLDLAGFRRRLCMLLGVRLPAVLGQYVTQRVHTVGGYQTP